MTWLFNETSIDVYSEISNGRIGARSSFLAIDGVSYDNAGIYACLARNKAGTHRHEARLHVNGYKCFFFVVVDFCFSLSCVLFLLRPLTRNHPRFTLRHRSHYRLNLTRELTSSSIPSSYPVPFIKRFLSAMKELIDDLEFFEEKILRYRLF